MTNLTTLIKTRLNEEIDHPTILAEVKEISPKPENWTQASINRILKKLVPEVSQTFKTKASLTKGLNAKFFKDEEVLEITIRKVEGEFKVIF